MPHHNNDIPNLTGKVLRHENGIYEMAVWCKHCHQYHRKQIEPQTKNEMRNICAYIFNEKYHTKNMSEVMCSMTYEGEITLEEIKKREYVPSNYSETHDPVFNKKLKYVDREYNRRFVKLYNPYTPSHNLPTLDNLIFVGRETLGAWDPWVEFDEVSLMVFCYSLGKGDWRYLMVHVEHLVPALMQMAPLDFWLNNFGQNWANENAYAIYEKIYRVWWKLHDQGHSLRPKLPRRVPKD
jgi:hypothetical protein